MLSLQGADSSLDQWPTTRSLVQPFAAFTVPMSLLAVEEGTESKETWEGRMAIWTDHVKSRHQKRASWMKCNIKVNKTVTSGRIAL